MIVKKIKNKPDVIKNKHDEYINMMSLKSKFRKNDFDF